MPARSGEDQAGGDAAAGVLQDLEPAAQLAREGGHQGAADALAHLRRLTLAAVVGDFQTALFALQGESDVQRPAGGAEGSDADGSAVPVPGSPAVGRSTADSAESVSSRRWTSWDNAAW